LTIHTYTYIDEIERTVVKFATGDRLLIHKTRDMITSFYYSNAE